MCSVCGVFVSVCTLVCVSVMSVLVMSVCSASLVFSDGSMFVSTQLFDS